MLSVIAYDSEDEAISIANDSKYGLHAAVIGIDFRRARRVVSQLRAGRVVINGITDDPQAPWGGFNYFGVGREYGRYGIEAFLENPRHPGGPEENTDDQTGPVGAWLGEWN